MAHVEEEMTTGDSRWERVFSLATRLFVWCVFFVVLYILRSFFLLVFLTFVFSYLQAHGVHLLRTRIKSRSLAVVLVGFAFLSLVIAIGSFIAPRVAAQAKLFVQKYPVYVQTIDQELLHLPEKQPFTLLRS